MGPVFGCTALAVAVVSHKIVFFFMNVLCTSNFMRSHRESTGGRRGGKGRGQGVCVCAHVSHALEPLGYCSCAVHVPTNANVPYDISDYI